MSQTIMDKPKNSKRGFSIQNKDFKALIVLDKMGDKNA